MGVKEEGDKASPIKIPFFEDYVVHKVSTGLSHSLVIASKKDNLEKKIVFSLGREEGAFSYLGIKEEDVKDNDDFVHHLKIFDHLEPYIVEAGVRTSFVAFEGDEDPSDRVSIHKGLTCEVTKESPIKGIMHFYKDSEKKWHYLSAQGYQKVKDDLPAIVYATKYEIKDLESKEWPKIDERELLSDKKSSYPVYKTNCVIGDKKLSQIEEKELGVFMRCAYDLDPLIFYRITRDLKEGKELPEIDLSKFYPLSEKKGLYIEIQPDYQFEKNDDIIAKNKETYDEIVEQINNFPKTCDNELKEVVEKYIETNSYDFVSNADLEIEASSLTFKSKKLKNLPEKTKQQRINALLEYNRYFLKTIPFVMLDEATLKEIQHQMKTKKQLTETLSVAFMKGKQMAFTSIKSSFIKSIVSNLQTNYDQPEIKVKRRLAQKFKDAGKVDHNGEAAIFSQIWKKLKEKNYISLRRNDSSDQCWSATFLGEGSIDAGGPYRDSITNMC